MNNLKKRCLTLLLSLAMIVTYMPTSMIAYAEADGETDPVQVEHQVEPEEPDAGVTSNDAVSEETQVEDDVKSEDAGSEDNAEDSKSEEAVSEEKGKDEASPEEKSSEDTAKSAGEESEEDAKAEAAEEAKEEFAGGKLGASSTHYKVNISYDADAKIPEGSTLELTEFAKGSEKYEEAKKELLKDDQGNSPFSEFDENATEEDLEGLGMAAFDLTIRDKDGKVVEPAPDAEVKVNVELTELPEDADAKALAESMEIQHLNESSGDVAVEKIATVDSQEAQKDKAVGEIAVNESKETASVETIIDAFSTFTITWRGTSYWDQARTVTVHYVDENGNELTIKNPDNTHQNLNASSSSPAFLIYDIDGYEYSYTYRNTNTTGNRIAPLLTKNRDNHWQYMRANSTSTTEMSNGDNIYVVYKEKPDITTGGTPDSIDLHDETWPEGDDAPQFSKSSTNNGNGTNTVALGITGGEKPVEKSTPADVIVVFDISGSMDYNMGGQSRLARAQAATNTMANTLLNGSNHDVRMALVTFSTDAQVEQGFTSDYTTFSRKVNSLDAEGGTNWEKALKLANEMEVRPKAATYIVFVTDGDPTFRVSRGDITNYDLRSDTYSDTTYRYYRNNYVFGEGDDDTHDHNFDYAVDQVEAINGANKNFYAIGISNSVTKVQNLTTEGGVDASHAFIASDSAAMEAAFKSITDSLKATLGYGDVEITDGITELAHVEMKVMQEVDPESFTYYKVTSSGQEQWDPTAEGAGLASYDKNTGAVTWDMGDGFQLEDGVTYMVTFQAWPSQEAYDLVAELNNGVKVYEAGHENSISEDERKQVVELAAPTETAQGSYALKTNTDTVKATVKKTSDQGGTVTISDDHPIEAAYHEGLIQNMALASELLTIKKIFDQSLDPRTVESVTLKLQRKINDDEHSMADYNAPGTSSPNIVLSDENNWEYSFYVAPGFIVDGETLEKGYQFTVVEPDLGENTVRYDLIPEIINPMVVDGTLQLIGDGDDNQALTAINRTRSAVEIHKTLYDVDGTTEIYPDTEFTIKGQLLGPDGKPYKDQVEADPAAYYLYDKDGNATTGRMHFPDSSNISFTLKAGEFIRFVNVPEGCTFEFQEDSIPETYEFKSLAAVGRQRNPETDPAYTYSIILDDAVAHLVEGDTNISTTNEGIIGNTNYKLDFFNKRVIPLPDVELIKVDQDDATKKLNGAAFELHKDSATGDLVTVDGNGKDIHIVTGNKEGSTGPDGWYDIGHLPEGTYYLVEVTEPFGYIRNKTPVKIEVTRDDDVYSVTATQDDVSVITGPSEDGVYTITVDNEKDTTHVSGTKTWEDGGNKDGRESITITVSAIIDGVKVANEYVVALAAGNGIDIVADEDDKGVWSFVIDGLRKYDSKGKLIVYEIAETAINDKPLDKNNRADGYEMTSETSTAEDGTAVIDITNTKLTEATVRKVWDDANNQDGKRPTELKVTLSNGTEVTLNEGNSWEQTVTGLPKYANGQLINYTWSEGNLPEGYTLTDTSVNGTVTTLTNSYTPETTEATVRKVWDDANNQDGKRPESLKVTLSNGTEVTLNEANKWTAKVDKLPKYKDGEEIAYTWTEGELPEGYTLTNTKTEGTITTLTNSHTPEETEATVKKVWDDANNQDGKRPAELKVTLSNGTEVTLNEANKWTATVDKLPKYKDGKEIAYTWTEGDLPEGYTLTNTKTEGTITTLTNSHTPEETEATVKKVWDDANNQDGKRPAELKVTLSNGTEVTLNEANKWTATVDKLPKYKDGKEIAYTWTEGELPEGYTLTNTKTEGTVTTLTNTHTPIKTTVTVNKVWTDENNRWDLRPAEIKVQLKAGEDASGEPVTLNKDNQWTHTWTELEAYKVGQVGQAISYTVEEVKVPGKYTASYSITGDAETGYVVTVENKLPKVVPAANGTELHIHKVDQDGNGLEGVKFILKNGNAELDPVVTNGDGDATIEIPVATNWLPAYEIAPNSDTYTFMLYEEEKAGFETAGPWNVVVQTVKDDSGKTKVDYTIKEVTDEETGDKKKILERLISWFVGSVGGESVNFVNGVATITNKAAKQTVTVTKTYEGINKLPDDFKITVNYTAYEQEKGGKTPPLELTQDMDPIENVVDISAVDGKITWTIKNVRYGTDFTATETGYEAQGYAVETKVAKSQTAAAGEERVITEGAVEETVEVPASNDAHIDFTNKYTCANLVINKTIDKLVSYDADEEVKNATFTFRIVGKAKGKTVLNTVAAVMFNAETKKSSSVKIDKIPANIDELTVTEIDSGNYEWAKVKEEAVTEENCTKTWTVSFNNTQQNGDYESGAINRYKKDGTGYVKDEGGNASTQTEEGGAGDNGQN